MSAADILRLALAAAGRDTTGGATNALTVAMEARSASAEVPFMMICHVPDFPPDECARSGEHATAASR